VSFAHPLWRAVQDNYEALRLRSPEGHVPAVDIHVAGIAPVRVGVVETHRDHPWALLHSLAVPATQREHTPRTVSSSSTRRTSPR
jgi:hypothetical protein